MAAALSGWALSFSADDPSPNYLTIGQMNGRAWLGMPANNRVIYAQAYTDGATWLFATLTAEAKDIPADALSSIVYKYFIASKFTLGDVVKEVNKLYAEDPANVILPIPEVLIAACLALNGASSAEVRQRIETKRTYYINK
jgi:hypothetical protein